MISFLGNHWACPKSRLLWRRRPGPFEHLLWRLGHKGHQQASLLPLQHVRHCHVHISSSIQIVSRHQGFLLQKVSTSWNEYSSYGHNVRIIHFIGASKPWHVKFDSAGAPKPRLGEEHTLDHLKQWWMIFHADVKPSMAQTSLVSHLTTNISQWSSVIL